MGFMDPDSGEVLLGKSAVDMDLEDLRPYCMALTKDVLGFRIIFDGKSNTLLRWLKAQYKRDAGLVIKWIFYEYGGLRDEEPFSLSWFCVGNKWWLDKAYAQAVRAYSPQPTIVEDSNFLSFEEFLSTPYVKSKIAVSV